MLCKVQFLLTSAPERHEEMCLTLHEKLVSTSFYKNLTKVAKFTKRKKSTETLKVDWVLDYFSLKILSRCSTILAYLMAYMAYRTTYGSMTNDLSL